MRTLVGRRQRDILDWFVEKGVGEVFSPHTVAFESGLTSMIKAVDAHKCLDKAYASARGCLARLTEKSSHRPAVLEAHTVSFEGWRIVVTEYSITRKGKSWYRKVQAERG